jgi:hypothetical protein
MVDLFVGEEKKLFRIHKGIICKIEVFGKMFNGGFKEGALGRAELPEDDPLTFYWLIEWVYRNDTETLSENDSIMQRISLYCIASKYRVTSLMDRLMDSIHVSVGKK